MSWIIHSAKGSTWEDHKYIKVDDGVYYYPDGYEGGRHLPDGEKADSKDKSKGDAGMQDWENKIHQHVAGIIDSHPELFKSGADVSNAILAPANTQAFKNTLKAFGLEPDKMSESELNQVRSKIAGYYSDAVADAKSGKGKSEKKDEKKDKKDEKKGEGRREPDEKMKEKAAEQVKKHKEQMDKYGIKGKGGSGNKVRKSGVQHSDYEGEYLAHFGILGMKWGVRRYQNKDGSLTALGRKRYTGLVEYDKNGMPIGSNGKSNESAMYTATNAAKASAEKDFKAGKAVFDSSSTAAQKLREINNISSDKKRAKKLKKLRINEMSDQELRDAVNRMQLEDNFSRLASERIETGRERTGEILAIAGNLLGVAGTAASIALAIHQIKNG